MKISLNTHSLFFQPITQYFKEIQVLWNYTSMIYEFNFLLISSQ